MFEYDMCLCASKDCPRYNECLRGAEIKRKGVYTTSYLGDICNENSNYETFIPIHHIEGEKNGRE